MLCAAIIFYSFAAALAPADPDLSARIHPDAPWLLLQKAEQGMKDLTADPAATPPAPVEQNPSTDGLAALSALAARQQSPQVPEEPEKPEDDLTPAASAPAPDLRDVARKILATEPLAARALVFLGVLAATDQQGQEADRLMEVAATRTLREGGALLWTARRYLEDNRVPEALPLLDAYLRKRNPAELAWPFLASLAQNKETSPLLTALLSENPPWRGRFFASLDGRVRDVGTCISYLLALKRSPAPPTSDEINQCVALLMKNGHIDHAYLLWLEFSPDYRLAHVGLINNGGFEIRPSGQAFDWFLPKQSGARVEITATGDPKQGRALHLHFDGGRITFQPITQRLILKPGEHQFSVRHRGQIRGPRGVMWRMRCDQGARAALGQSPIIRGGGNRWTAVEMAVSIPPSDCRTQTLSLELVARSASETMVTGTIAFDDANMTKRALSDLTRPVP